MKIHPIDDYNRTIHWNGKVVGSITTQFGNPALRHGWKLLVKYEERDNSD